MDYEMRSDRGMGFIRDMAMIERPTTRLQKLGSSALKDSELLAIVTGARSLDTTARLLEANSLAELLAMPLGRLKRLKGIGGTGAAVLVAARELVRRVDSVKDQGLPVIQSMNDIVTQSVDMRDKKKEHLIGFFLNARHQLITKEVISIGTLTASLAHPREIFAPAIANAAAGVILVHNHPSGDPTPSDDDIRLTKRISQAGHLMGIDLLDHLIVAANGCYSFKQAGAL